MALEPNVSVRLCIKILYRLLAATQKTYQTVQPCDFSHAASHGSKCVQGGSDGKLQLLCALKASIYVKNKFSHATANPKSTNVTEYSLWSLWLIQSFSFYLYIIYLLTRVACGFNKTYD